MSQLSIMLSTGHVVREQVGCGNIGRHGIVLELSYHDRLEWFSGIEVANMGVRTVVLSHYLTGVSTELSYFRLIVQP